MYIRMPVVKRNFRGLAWKLFNTIENNGNNNFEKNGEKIFITNLIQTFKVEENRGGKYLNDDFIDYIQFEYGER